MGVVREWRSGWAERGIKGGGEGGEYRRWWWGGKESGKNIRSDGGEGGRKRREERELCMCVYVALGPGVDGQRKRLFVLLLFVLDKLCTHTHTHTHTRFTCAAAVGRD